MEADPRELVGRAEALLGEVERLPDPLAREQAMEAVQALLEVYGHGLERIVEILAEHDDGALAAALGDDELVAHLLLLHGLHPVPLEDRVRGALDEVRPYLESHGGGVELLRIDADAVQLRLEGSCSGCPSSAMTLKLAIEKAIQKAAPEIERIEAGEGGASAPAADAGLLQIEVSPALAAPAASAAGEWSMVGGLSELSSGAFVVKPIDGQRLLFLKLGDRFYGYHPECPACAEPLEAAQLQGAELVCASCAKRYDVMRAGRCLDSPQLHLEPVPLLADADGLIRVALATPA